MARNVRIATISYNGRGSSPEEKRAHGLALLDSAGAFQPDVACLPETFTGLGAGWEGWRAAAEPLPGPTSDAAAEIARKHSMYVVCPILRRRGDRLHNAAALLDRSGEIVGAYHKNHPTLPEIEAGVTPGSETPVFETDFGRVGFAICFDLNFRDVIEGLARGGPELVFFPSMYCGGLQLQVWAHDFGVFVASAHSGGRSAVVDPLGRVLKWSSVYEPILVKEVNLDGVVCHIDENERKWPAIREKYGAAVELDVATDEARFRLISHHPTLTAWDVVEEFGLEPLPDYFGRSDRGRGDAMAAPTAPVSDIRERVGVGA
jgi:predicted amidohydrolase